MQASNIIELNGRGIPAILHSAKIVDVCAYLKSSGTPAALVLSDRGDVRGVLSEGDIIGAAGRLGSSVMQMMAGELMREQAPMCQSDTDIVEVLEVLSEAASNFVLVAEARVIKGLVTIQDVAELLTSALAGGDQGAADVATAPEAVPDELQVPQQAAHMPPSEDAIASGAVAAAVTQTAAAMIQPEAAVTGGEHTDAQFSASDQVAVAPAAYEQMLQSAPQVPQAAPASQPPAQQAVQLAAEADLAQPAVVTAPVSEAVAVPASPPVSAPAASVTPTVSSLLQGQPATPAPAAPVPAVNAHTPPAQPQQSSQAPISAAAAAARAIAARMQAPQADFAAPGSSPAEAQAPGASGRAGWASFKAS